MNIVYNTVFLILGFFISHIGILEVTLLYVLDYVLLVLMKEEKKENWKYRIIYFGNIALASVPINRFPRVVCTFLIYRMYVSRDTQEAERLRKLKGL